MIVHGVTQPDARVTLRGEPVRLRPDGSFAVRFSLPDRRHVLPVVANSGDGAEQRTIVLAIDRNTKVMEPVIRDPGGLIMVPSPVRKRARGVRAALPRRAYPVFRHGRFGGDRLVAPARFRP